MPYTIQDRVASVALELGNRGDITSGTPSRVHMWLRDSYIELGSAISFTEMEMSKTDQLASDIYNYPDDCRAIKALTAYHPIGGSAIPIDIKDIATIRRFGRKDKGPPSIACIFGGSIIVRPVLDKSYPLVIDYWQKPQILDTGGSVVTDNFNTTDISTTPLLMPDDWLELIDKGAVLRGYSNLLENDKAMALQQLLYGFTMPTTGRLVPGLIAQKLTRKQAQAPWQDYGLVPSQARRSYTG